MENKDILNKLYPVRKKESPEDLIEGINKTKTISLKEAIEEITAQIEIRKRLHKELIDDITKVKATIHGMTPIPTDENREIVLEFQKRIIEADEIKIQEKLNCFRDIAALKKELREWLREFRDKEKRASLLGELISDKE